MTSRHLTLSERIRKIPEMTLAELLSAWPRLMRYFLERGFHCTGCPMAGFETLKDVASEYKVDHRKLLKDIQEIASK